MTDATLTLTDAQLRCLRCLRRNGWCVTLESYIMSRNGASAEEWQQLRKARLVLLRAGRFRLTADGKRAYNRQSKGRYF